MGAMSGLTLGEIEDAVLRLLTAGRPLSSVFEPPPPPSRRRPRRGDVVTYRVRVDLKGTKPPLWRRIEVSSDLFLDQVHEIIQAVFGWTNGHLHHFGSGPGHYGWQTELYLCPFEVEEGGPGIPEADVRLDEVLAEVGDKLFYDYDFGDDWQHTLRLEAVLPRRASGPRAVCTAGRRDGPAEDCGGVYGYELICAATDPDHPGHAGAAAEYERIYGDGVPEYMGPTRFDIDQVNERLARLLAPASRGDPADGDAGPDHGYPGPLDELVHAVRTAAGQRELRQLLGRARLDHPVLVDVATAGRMVRPYAWLLSRVGDNGIRLTAAGYLPPADVEAAMADLGPGEQRIGRGNRENLTLPVLHLRESATRLGLLHKRRGMLLLTAQGRRLRGDPVALWWHLAGRMPLRSRDECETQAGLILLTALAAEAGGDPDVITARLLGAIGWVSGDGSELAGFGAGQAAWDTKTVLRRLGALADDEGLSRAPRLTAEGVTFARAALRTWPTA